MHRSPISRITTLYVICTLLVGPGLFGQQKAGGDIDVARCWSYPLSDVSGQEIIANNRANYLGLSGGRIEALAADGKRMWSSELGGEISSNIVATEDSLYLTTSVVSSDPTSPSENKLRCLSIVTGITNFTAALPAAEKHYLYTFNTSVIVASKSGVIEAIDAANGKVKWTRQIADNLAAEPAFAADSVTVATGGDQIFVISLAAGDLVSMRKVSFGVTALAAAANGKLIVGDERGNIFTVAGDGKPSWTFKMGAAVSHIVSVDDNILAASNDNFVYFLAGKNGGRIWKKRFSRRVSQMVVVEKLLAMISSLDEHAAALVDLSNGRTVGQIVFGEGESFISASIVSNGIIAAVTGEAAYSFSINGGAGCLKTKE